MKKIIFITLSILFIVSCGKTAKKSNESTCCKKETTACCKTQTPCTDESVVNVYYFHGKQRCKTCIAVGDVTKKTIETAYADNGKVIFTEIQTDDKNYEKLVEKYEVSWNALIIAKGEDATNITEEAFANAVNSPEKLTEMIKTEVNNRLQ